MNKRIKELALQSNMVVAREWMGANNTIHFEKFVPIDDDSFTDNLQKFAELIIQECLTACCRANKVRHVEPPSQERVVLNCMREIKQHFGVEE